MVDVAGRLLVCDEQQLCGDHGLHRAPGHRSHTGQWSHGHGGVKLGSIGRPRRVPSTALVSAAGGNDSGGSSEAPNSNKATPSSVIFFGGADTDNELLRFGSPLPQLVATSDEGQRGMV